MGEFYYQSSVDARLVPDDAYEAVAHDALFNIPFTFGVPFEMQIRAVARCGVSARPVSFASSGYSNFLDGVYWSGIQSVTAGGNQIEGYQVTAASGTDYTQAFSPTPLLPGDIDLDDDVDARDAALFTQFLGISAGASWFTGDFNGDATTTLDDLTLLQVNFGAAAPSPAASATAVPEPTTWPLVLGLVVVAALTVARGGGVFHPVHATHARSPGGSR
jgi:hypothetical protein